PARLTSRPRASSTWPGPPSGVRRSPVLLVTIRTVSAVRWSLSRMAFVSGSLRVCSRLMSVDPLGLALPLLVAQDELRDLARRGLGQIAELDGGRALEVGDVLPAELDDLLLGGLPAGLARHEGLGPLAPSAAGHG